MTHPQSESRRPSTDATSRAGHAGTASPGGTTSSRRRGLPIAAKFLLVLVLMATSLLGAVAIGANAQSRMKAAADALYAENVRDLKYATELNGALGEAGSRALQLVAITRPERLGDLRGQLFERVVPDIDHRIAVLVEGAHDAAESERVRELRRRWEAYKDLLRSPEFELTSRTVTAGEFNDALAERLAASQESLRSSVMAMEDFMIAEAGDASAAISRDHRSTRRNSALLLAGALLAGIGSIVWLIRDVVPRVKRYSRFAAAVTRGDLSSRLEPKGSDELSQLGRALDELVEHRFGQHVHDRSQAEFGEALQVSENEQEAHTLLKRHLERSIPAARAIVMNRNNSDNRLQVTTELPDGSPVPERLGNCPPRTCLAVRFSRPHDELPGGEALMSCAVCKDEQAPSRCEPLLVGGEVIGSVLVQGDSLGDRERRKINESVVLAAPVLANLRNLALAEHRALNDALTGLPNQRASRDTLLRMVAQASRSVQSIAAVLVDLDHFKQVNDLRGHETGDQALAAVGAALSSAVRSSDFAGRYGGEEFLLLLPDTGRDGALAVAENVRRAIEGILIPGLEGRITASLGIAVLPDDAGDAETLVRQADRAMYTAKAAGRNRTMVVSGRDENAGVDSAEAVHRSA